MAHSASVIIMPMPDQTPYWIALSRVPGIGPMRMRKLLDYFGDAATAWGAMLGDLKSAGLEPRVAEALLTTRRTTDPDREMGRLDDAGAQVLPGKARTTLNVCAR